MAWWGLSKLGTGAFAVTLERVGGDEGGHRQLMARCNGETESESKKEESTDNKVALAGINLPHTLQGCHGQPACD